MANHQLFRGVRKVQECRCNRVLQHSIWLYAGAIFQDEHVAVSVAAEPLVASGLVNHCQFEPGGICVHLRVRALELRRCPAGVCPGHGFTGAHRSWNSRDLEHILYEIRQWFSIRLIRNQLRFQLKLSISSALGSVWMLELQGKVAHCFFGHCKSGASSGGCHQKLHLSHSGNERVASSDLNSIFPQGLGALA